MVRGACFRTFALFAAANLQPPYGAALPRFHGVSRGETPERLTAERQVFAYPPLCRPSVSLRRDR
jgi:hypothetical protein